MSERTSLESEVKYEIEWDSKKGKNKAGATGWAFGL